MARPESNMLIKEETNCSSCKHCSYNTCQCLPRPYFDCTTSKFEPYFCKNCNFKCNLVVSQRKHTEEAHRETDEERSTNYTLSSYVCRSCSFDTYSYLQWLKHVAGGCPEHKLDENYLELEPNKVQVSKRRKKSRKSSSNPKRIFQCDECEFKTRNKHYLTQHKTVKHAPEEAKIWFECDQCAFKTNYKSHFRTHLLIKHAKEKDKKWFKCESCSFKTVYRDNFRKHFLARHVDDKDKKWMQCEKCSYKTHNKGHLRRHFSRMHTNRDKEWYECDTCPFKTTYKRFFRKHLREKVFQCDECDFVAKYKLNLSVHKRIKHGDVKQEK